jgi:hypothetical protein
MKEQKQKIWKHIKYEKTSWMVRIASASFKSHRNRTIEFLIQKKKLNDVFKCSLTLITRKVWDFFSMFLFVKNKLQDSTTNKHGYQTKTWSYGIYFQFLRQHWTKPFLVITLFCLYTFLLAFWIRTQRVQLKEKECIFFCFQSVSA